MTLIDEIIRALQADQSIETKEQFQVLRNAILAKTAESTSPANIVFIERYNELVASGEFESSNRVRRVLRKRAVRSLSGVAVISLLTKFWGCPGKCIYCPTYE
jgi:elongator complex protein 3